MPSGKETFTQWQKGKSKRSAKLKKQEKAQSGMTAEQLEATREALQMQIAESQKLNVSKKKKEKVEQKVQEILAPLHKSGLPALKEPLVDIDLCEKVKEYYQKGELALLLQPYGPEIAGELMNLMRETQDDYLKLAVCKAIADILKNLPKTVDAGQITRITRIERVIVDVRT